MSKRSEKKLNEIFKQYGFNPESEEKPINPRIKVEMDETNVKVYKGTLIDKVDESNQEEAEILLLDYLRDKESSIIDENEVKKSKEPVYFYYDPVSGRNFKYIHKVRFRFAEDAQNILENIDIDRILNFIKPLSSLILKDNYEQLNSSILENLSLLSENKSKNKSKIVLEKLIVDLKFNLNFLISQTARIINEFLIKPQFTLSEFESLLKTTTNKDKLTLVEKIDVSDISLILEGINRIFPEIKFDLLNIKKKRVKPKNKAYKLNNNEWTPNSPQSNDILSSIIKPNLWTEDNNKFECLITHPKQKGYSQLNLFKIDSTGDLVPNDNYSAENILNGFDLRDRKILRLLMIEAVLHKGEPFDISGKWILKLNGDDRSSVSVNGKRLTSLEKLEDLERRLWSYDAIKFHWRYKVGKKEFNNLPDGFPIKATFKIFSISGVSINKDGRGYELTGTITPSDWFEFNQKTLQQFTKIPKQLLAIDIYKYPRAYLIGERICELFRFNKQKFAKSGNNYQTPLTITIKSLLDEIIAPNDLEKALSDPKKGHRLKERIIEDTKYLAHLLNWQFNWQGVKEGDNFTSFYNSASFTVILDCELESEILGEKVVETKAKKVKTPLSLDGEQIKALRKKLKLTQAKFAEILGYSRSQLANIERGYIAPSQEFIKVIINKYKHIVDELS